MRRLSSAIWVIAIISIINLLLSIYSVIFPWLLVGRMNAALKTPEFKHQLEQATDQLNSFHSWPVQKQIETASVIALARWEKEGDRYKCVISEILKQRPGTEFYYKVGDEFVHLSRRARDNTDYGDGQIMFFVGSPAEFRYSTSFKGDRISGLGDMPVGSLRATIQK